MIIRSNQIDCWIWFWLQYISKKELYKICITTTWQPATFSFLFYLFKLVSYLFDMAMRLPFSRREFLGVNAERELLYWGFWRYLIVFKTSIPTSRYMYVQPFLTNANWVFIKRKKCILSKGIYFFCKTRRETSILIIKLYR